MKTGCHSRQDCCLISECANGKGKMRCSYLYQHETTLYACPLFYNAYSFVIIWSTNGYF